VELENNENRGHAMKYVFGAYGTNNLGDDAIYEGIKKEIGDVIQIYVNKSNVSNSVWYADLLENKYNFSNDADELIIGGGGLFHSRNAIVDYVKIVDKALITKMEVSIQGVGVEGLQDDYLIEAKELCSRCSKIVVRSKKSQILLQEKLNIKSELRKDFAYNIKENSITIPSFENNLPIIGFITGGNEDKESIEKISNIIEFFTVGGGVVANFLHIPHSKSYVNYKNNDVVTGEIIWSNISIYHANREGRYKIMPFVSSPQQLLSIYQQVDGIIGCRYHSMIFSEMMKKPLLGFISGLKTQSYFDENQRDNSRGINFNLPVETLINETKNFIKLMEKIKL
jgi:hypothetical protein